ncbi:hypothetical protein COPEUT_02560 [Coprococcus eutactus ATCC 27759]|nr:hypothetical protein COPEUT_02560 [Coprococcus eutactus ATCC 27759]
MKKDRTCLGMTGLLYFDKNPVLYYFRYITNGRCRSYVK